MAFDHRSSDRAAGLGTCVVQATSRADSAQVEPAGARRLGRLVSRGMQMLPAVGMLMISGPVSAQTILTVGPDGAYTTVGSAASQIVNGSDYEIRIQEGDHWGGVGLVSPGSFTSGSVVISGGWTSTFSIQRPHPNATRLHEGRMGIWIQGGSYRVENLTSRDSTAGLDGGAMDIHLSGDAHVRLERLWIVANQASVSMVGDLHGGGVNAVLTDSSRIEIADCEVSRNVMEPTLGEAAYGGGIYLSTSGSSTALLVRTRIEGNSCASSVSGRYGGGLFVFAQASSSVELIDCTVRGNTLGAGTGSSEGSGAFITVNLTGHVVARRVAWLANLDTGTASAAQAHINVASDATVEVTDSVVCSGNDIGVQAYSQGALRLTNLTVAENAGDGVKISTGSSLVSLYNTIAFLNGTDTNINGTIASGGNLIGVDPIFDDPVG